MAEGPSLNLHMLKMMGYLEKLDKLKAPIPADIAENIILDSLPSSYKDFVLHLHMREKTPTLDEIHQSLKQVEVDLNKGKGERNVLTISQENKKISKNKGKRVTKTPTKGKGKGVAQVSTSKSRKPTPQTKCLEVLDVNQLIVASKQIAN